uniref:porin n=1 Tax=Klebsiella pneumoniae TaxID=573 RepID=UPI00222F0510
MHTPFKKTLMAGAALLAAAGTLPGAAHAQSNVTLYGRVVAGVEHIAKIADPVTGQTTALPRAADNQWGTSMIGFRGKEDLG